MNNIPTISLDDAISAIKHTGTEFSIGSKSLFLKDPHKAGELKSVGLQIPVNNERVTLLPLVEALCTIAHQYGQDAGKAELSKDLRHLLQIGFNHSQTP